jgi:sortase A
MQDSRSGDRANARPARERAITRLRVAERSLVAIGLLCVLVYVSACAHRSFFQSAERSAFDRSLNERVTALVEQEDHDQGDWSRKRIERYASSRSGDSDFESATNTDAKTDAKTDASTDARPNVASDAMGRLEIPSANVSVMVLDGTDDVTLDRAVGHIEGTAGPGESGNFGIAGHRDGFFRGLQHVQVGDEMSFASLDGLARYEIEAIDIVAPEAVEVLDPTDHASMTLVTCYPFYYVGSAPKRYIVKGRRVSFDAWTPELLSSYTEQSPTYASAPALAPASPH